MTSVVRWEPIEDLKAIRDVVKRTFVQPLATFKHLQVLGVRNPVDIYERVDAFVAEMEAPGLKSEDLNISVTGHKLTIRVNPPAAGRLYVHRERARQPFSRSLIVPWDVDVAAISARLQNGMLILTMPRKSVNPEPAE